MAQPGYWDMLAFLLWRLWDGVGCQIEQSKLKDLYSPNLDNVCFEVNATKFIEAYPQVKVAMGH